MVGHDIPQRQEASQMDQPATDNSAIGATEQVAALEKQFAERFGRPATVAAVAPGRVNLIGEHTDYNDGFVLPMAIERQTAMVAAPRDDQQVTIASTMFDEPASYEASDQLGPGEPSWSNYTRGLVALMIKQGMAVPGFDAMLDSTVPLGSGLSSSASLEIATATLIEQLVGQTIDPVKKAMLGQATEHEFAGVPCGIMDQFISTMGRQGEAVLIDCRSHAVRHVALSDPSIVVLIINSNVKHGLVDGEYAARRAQCEAAAKILGVKALRDANAAMLEAAKATLDDVQYRRARHVIGEDQRTLEAADAMDAGQWQRVGELMFQSHASLRDDYEVSCPELDTLVELASEQAGDGGVVGSRMTGGGFGGCTVTLARADKAQAIAKSVAKAYQQRTSIEAEWFISRPADGARPMPLT